MLPSSFSSISLSVSSEITLATYERMRARLGSGWLGDEKAVSYTGRVNFGCGADGNVSAGLGGPTLGWREEALDLGMGRMTRSRFGGVLGTGV